MNIVQVFGAGDLLDVILLLLPPFLRPSLDLGVVVGIGPTTLTVEVIDQEIFLVLVLYDLDLVRLGGSPRRG